MAITKVAAPNSVPVDVSDYVAQNAHIMAFISQVNSQAFILTDPMGTAKPNIAQGAYISHGGSLYVVDSGDEIISGTPADGKVYVKVSGSATLTAEFITDISGFSFSFVNNAFINSAGDTLLPYEIRKSGGDWLKYRYDAVQRLQAGEVSAENIFKLQGRSVFVIVHSTIKSSFNSPSTNPYGLTFDGNDLISCNSSADKIYIHNGISSTIKSSFNSPSTSPSGLTFDGNDLISCDAIAGKIYIHNGISSTIKSSFNSPSTNPYGLTFDGNDLISCDASADKIYIHNGISSTIKSSFNSPSTFPTGLTFDGNDLISCDASAGNIYIHNGISSTIKSSFNSPSTSPSGLTFDGNDLISCDASADKIYIHGSFLGV